MRIVRLKLKPDVSKLLAVIARENALPDPGFIEDVFALMRLRGNGIPDKTRIDAMAHVIATKIGQREVGINLLLSKRKMMLDRLVQLPYFLALSSQTDLIDSCRRLMVTFRTFYKKVRQAQCLTCNYKPNCDFGKQYGGSVAKITNVIDPNYSKKVHPDCPVRPEIDSTNQLVQAMQKMQQMLNKQSKAAVAAAQAADPNGGNIQGAQQAIEDMDDPTLDADVSDEQLDPEESGDYMMPDSEASPGQSIGFKTSFTAQHFCTITEQYVKDVSMGQLVIYELGSKLDIALQGREVEDFKPVPYTAKDKDPDHIKSVTEIAKVQSSQYALDDEVFEAKLMKKELVKHEFKEPQSKKKLLYLLVDSSGSMSTGIGHGGSAGNVFTRGSLATVLCMALVRKVARDEGICYARFFEGSPGPLNQAVRKDEFPQLEKWVADNDYNGGGTSIISALKAAARDIKNADKDSPLAKSIILLITDGDDWMKRDDVKKVIGESELHVLDVAGGGRSTINEELKASATKYFKADESVPDINKLVREVV